MRGDFSRIRFTPAKQYTAVLEQQGRVALDADANEQCAIDGYLRRTETIDVVGDFGAPIDDAGFGITIEDNEIVIGAGRYYVEGLMCENQADLAYGNQPYLINLSVSDADLLTELTRAKGAAAIRVWLEVWQRLVTALDDPCLREPALGQADTTARLQTVWRVVAKFVDATTTTSGGSTPAPPVLTGVSVNTVDTARSFSPAVNKRLTIPNSGLGNRPINIGTRPPVNLAGGGTTALGSGTTPVPQVDCCAEMYAYTPTVSTGKLSAQTSGGTDTCSCQPIPAAGYRGLENQLYRVEIQRGGADTKATFKWSRENGSVVSAIQKVSGSTIWLDSLGPDANLGFQADQWVEIYDDTYVFAPRPNRPGELYQIQKIVPTSKSIILYTPVVSIDPSQNARVRRWDQSGASAASDGIPLSAGIWLDLENGIQVNFATGDYQSGDYWSIPARTASGTIDWPPCGSDGAAFQPPLSTNVYHAPLACIHWDDKKEAAIPEDCRRFFSPLTALTAPVTPQAIHVSTISWTNDDVTTLDQLVANGLTVTLDNAPSGPINGANFIVTFEPAAPPANTNNDLTAALQRSIFEGVPSTILRGITIVDSLITVESNTILWQLPYLESGYAQRITILYLDELLSFGAAVGWFARVRIRMMGRTVFSGSGTSQLFLDGQSYSQAALRADGTTPRIDLQLPSGNNEKASDFEGWFYVAPTLTLVSITTNYSAFTVVVNSNNVVTGATATPVPGAAPEAVTPQATITVNYPAIADTTIGLVLTGTSGAGTVASVPSTATISKGQSSTTVKISILSNPGVKTTLTFQITASLNSALGQVAPVNVSFTVTGVQAPSPPIP
jgi:uncharacterized protein DUF6519